MSQQPCEGTYTVNIPADNRVESAAREAMIAVRFASVTIERPDKLKVFGYPNYVNLYALEATQLESPLGIQKLTILALSVAVRTLQMVKGRDNSELSVSIVFDREQQQCLFQISTSYQGQLSKQKNPYPHDSLLSATWLIARLGGWSGLSSQRPPGMPTIIHGLRRFESIFLGWKLFQNQLVCTR